VVDTPLEVSHSIEGGQDEIINNIKTKEALFYRDCHVMDITEFHSNKIIFGRRPLLKGSWEIGRKDFKKHSSSRTVL